MQPKGPNHSLAGEISDSNVDGWELKFLDMYIHEINIYDIIINIYIYRERGRVIYIYTIVKSWN